MKFFNLPVLFVFFLFTASAFAQKMTAEEIVAKHLDSIGTKEKRAAIKNILATGDLQFKILRAPIFNKGNLSTGKIVFISEADKIYLGAKLDSRDYPFEEIVFDGKRLSIAYIQPGSRSVLGNFIYTNRYIVEEGLLGGNISAAWSLLDWQLKKAKIKNDGKKKINGRETYVVNYIGQTNTLFSIKFYFDTETFQLLRTEHQYTYPRPLATTPGASSAQVTTTHKLTEDFSNYKQVGGLRLPHSYQINFLVNGSTTNEFEWKFEFSEFLFNEKIDAATFEAK